MKYNRYIFFILIASYIHTYSMQRIFNSEQSVSCLVKNAAPAISKKGLETTKSVASFIGTHKAETALFAYAFYRAHKIYSEELAARHMQEVDGSGLALSQFRKQQRTFSGIQKTITAAHKKLCKKAVEVAILYGMQWVAKKWYYNRSI